MTLSTILFGPVSDRGLKLGDGYVGPYSPEDRLWIGAVARHVIYQYLPERGARGHDWGSSTRLYVCNRLGLETASTRRSVQEHGSFPSLADRALRIAEDALLLEKEGGLH
jgi:hypothetical protein